MKRIAALPLWVLLVVVGGCRSGADAPPDEVTPRERLESAVATWNATQSFHFTLQLENRSIPLDQSGFLSFSQVEGDIVAPDRMQAQTTVRTPVGNAQVAYIAIGDSQWLTNPLTRRWEPAPAEAAVAVGRLFDPQEGIGATIVEMQDPQVVGEEVVEGARSTRVSGGLPGSVLAEFAPDLAEVPRVDVDIHIGVDDNRIRQILVREPQAADTPPATWTFRFSRFDEPISIQPPA